jgi:superfamily II DNA/RNA helicase
MSDHLLDINLDEPEITEETTDVKVNGFALLGLDAKLIDNLDRNDITEPTPIQLQGIPLLLEGKDLIACAPTGTGKTAAFVLPALQRLLTPSDNTDSRGPRVVVLTPTRELAQQVSKASMMMAGKLPRMKTVCITGGEPFRDQLRNISMPHEIIVATPGRLLDHISRGKIDLSRVEIFVLDEADRMLDMGFSDDVQAIGERLPKGHQTICFSATFDDSVKSFASKLLNEPAWLQVAATRPNHESIVQQVHYADGIEHKRAMLHHWLGQIEDGQAVVFTATKRDAEELAMSLREAGMSADPLHGDMVQRQRTRMIQRLRKGETQILVATDVASRGIDVPGITHVFNFDLPKFAEDYVHRIGRTGRAGRTGAAVSFVSKMDVQSLGRIEKLLSTKINITEIDGLAARFKPQEGRGFGGGGRGGFGGGRRDGGGFGGGRRDGGGFGGQRRDGGSSFGGGRRDGGDRPSYGDRPARSASDRPSFGDRPSYGDRPARPAGDRPSYGDRPARPAGDRPQRSASDRPSYGDRPARPAGDRPSYGDRPARTGGERFDSRTDNRFGGDNRGQRRHAEDRPRTNDDSRPRFNREAAASTGHHHGQQERATFRDRDDHGTERTFGRRNERHDPTSRSH